MTFEHKSTGDTCDIYEWTSKNEMERVLLFHWHEPYKNTVEFVRESFVLNDESLFYPMQDEKDTWIKHSAKYGHWENGSVELDAEALEYAMSVLMGK